MRFRFLAFLIFVFHVFATAQNVPNYVPTNGLVGWWPFSGNAKDSSGLGNDGTVTSAILAPDRFGKANAAYAFNGSTSKIDVADAASLRVQQITISAWVFANSNILGQLVYKGSMTADGEAYALNSGLNFGIKINSGCVAGAGWKGATLSKQLTVGTWEHLLATYDGQTIKFYRNGHLDTVVNQTGNIDLCTGGGLRFGFDHLRYNASTGDPFNGLIDDIGIWNRALTEVEVKQLYNASTTVFSGNVGINVANPERPLHVNDVLRLTPRAYPPATPSKGDMYFDSTINKLRVYDGTAWQNCW